MSKAPLIHMIAKRNVAQLNAPVVGQQSSQPTRLEHEPVREGSVHTDSDSLVLRLAEKG